MARIRTIKPELLENEKTATLSHLEWRLFVSLLLLADDYGNFRANPARVAGAALWAHEDDVGAALKAIEAKGLIGMYVVDGQTYAHVSGWEKHQKVDHPGKPSCPGPEEAPRETLAKPSRDTSETLATPSRLIGSDRIGSEISPPAPARDPKTPEQRPETPVVPIGGHALAALFGRIRCEVTGSGIEWQGTPTQPEKAASMAAAIEDQGFRADVEPTMREFWRRAKAGTLQESAKIIRSPSFAFGCWCSAFPELLEALRGRAPPVPAERSGPRCWFHQKPGTNGKANPRGPDEACAECRHVSASRGSRASEPSAAAAALPKFVPPPAWTPEQLAEAKALRGGQAPPAKTGDTA